MTKALAKIVKSSSGDNANARKKILLTPRPYTEYHIFFRLERTYLLQSTGIIDEEVDSSLVPSRCDPVEFPRPARYERLALPPYWYSSSHEAAIEMERTHRKRVGRMDLKTLSEAVSASWKKADPVVVNYCRKLAKAEMEKYEEIVNMKNENQDDKATDADAREKATSGVLKHRRQEQALLLPKNKPPKVESAAQSVLAPNQAERVAPVVTPNGNLKQATNTTMPMSMPAAAAPVTVSNDINRSRDGFNEVMGDSSSGLQINQEHETVLQVLRLQAVQQQNMNIIRGAISPSSPFTNARDLRVDHSSAPVTSSPPFANGSVPDDPAADVRGGVGPEDLPGKKSKRNLVRRASAPPEFLTHGNVLTRPGADDDDLVACRAAGGGDADALLGEDRPKRMKRTSSMTDLNDEARGLSDSFEKELDNGCFSHVPNWEKEDADKMLDLLDVPRVGKPAVGNDRASEFVADQEMRFMNDIGIGDDSYCKVI